MKQPLSTALFLIGLAIVGWIGVGYVGTHALGVVVTLVIGACYIAGAVELQRYRQATATLAHALTDTSPAGNGLQAWLSPLHPSLRQAVRLRSRGQPVVDRVGGGEATGLEAQAGQQRVRLDDLLERFALLHAVVDEPNPHAGLVAGGHLRRQRLPLLHHPADLAP